MRKPAPLAAAVVNGAVVLLLPTFVLLLFAVIRANLPVRYTSGAVHARAVSPIVSAIQASIDGIFLTIPLASIAAWRTWVHATRWQNQKRTWRGVAEAGAVGALFVMVRLASAAWAAGSIVGFLAIPVYAAIGGLVGLVVGLLLHLTAVAVLKMASLS